MEETIAYCGLICQTCPIYLATREQYPKKKLKMRIEVAKICNEHYGTQYEPEDIADCDGCKAESGRIFCQSCKIRQCASRKSVENCAHCNEYACETLEEFFAKDQEARKRLDAIRSAL
jgi:hypothetical protein